METFDIVGGLLPPPPTLPLIGPTGSLGVGIPVSVPLDGVTSNTISLPSSAATSVYVIEVSPSIGTGGSNSLSSRYH